MAEILLLAHGASGFILFVTSDCQLWHYPWLQGAILSQNSYAKRVLNRIYTHNLVAWNALILRHGKLLWHPSWPISLKSSFLQKKDVKILTNCWISDKQGNGNHFVACTENNLAIWKKKRVQRRWCKRKRSMQMADVPVTYLILTIKTANCTVHKKL